METTYHLFVYGSLRSGFRNPAYQYIADYFSLVGEGVVRGKFFDKGEYPVAIAADDDSFITGELYLAKNKEAFESSQNVKALFIKRKAELTKK